MAITSKIFLFIILIPFIHSIPVAYSNTHSNNQTSDCDTCEIESPDRLYIIESIESRVIFKLSSLATFGISGVAANPNGYISHNAGLPVNSRVSVLLTTSGISMQNQLYDKLIKGSKFLDVEQYPTISFVSKKIELDENGDMLIHGDLSIRSITRQETLKASLVRDETDQNAIKFIADTQIKRSNYDINSLKLLLSDNVELIIEVTGKALHSK